MLVLAQPVHSSHLSACARYSSVTSAARGGDGCLRLPACLLNNCSSLTSFSDPMLVPFPFVVHRITRRIHLNTNQLSPM